ncbi:MAG: hypothetical protein JWQ21_1557 [Herminiimonas sp.]|nr:hypothetical protein [Herminiimonas sp.]
MRILLRPFLNASKLFAGRQVVLKLKVQHSLSHCNVNNLIKALPPA